MLIAISSLFHRRVCADDIDRTHPCTCPECDASLVYKRGRIVTAHFAHHSRSGCSLSEGESIRHLQMKAQMKKLLAPVTRVELEWSCAPGRRADIFLPDMDLVVECQASPISLDEWESRMTDYAQIGLDVVWVWDICRLYGKKTLTCFPPAYDPDAWAREHLFFFKTYGYMPEQPAEPEYRVPAEIRFCFDQLHIGHVLALDHLGSLRACLLLPAPTRYSEWYDEDGEHQEREHTPVTLRRIRCSSPVELIDPHRWIRKPPAVCSACRSG